MPVQKKDYALIVGINHYPKFRDLSGAIEDAKAFDKWLTNRQTGGGVPKKNRVLITSKENKPTPQQSDIDDALENLLEGVSEVRRFYLYFSGHGLASSRMGADLCTAVWSHMRRNAALRSEAYHDYLSDTGKFTELVFFLDCCRLREVNARGKLPDLAMPSPHENAGSERRLIGYSTEYQNPAYEAKNGKEDEDVRGYFTRALIEALSGKAARPEGGVTASRLKTYLDTRTRDLAKKDGRKQTPEIELTLDENALFGTALSNRKVAIEFSEERHGRSIKLLGPDNREVDSLTATSEVLSISLGEGVFILLDTETKTVEFINEGEEHVRF